MMGKRQMCGGIVGVILAFGLLLSATPAAAAIDEPVAGGPSKANVEQSAGSLGGGDVTPMSANGCTQAPGPAGAHNCVIVGGDHTKVTSAVSNYYYLTPIGPNICNRTHQFKYTLANGTVLQPVFMASGCITPPVAVVTGDYVALPGVSSSSPLYLKANTQFCTRANNSATGGVWTSWACISILP